MIIIYLMQSSDHRMSIEHDVLSANYDNVCVLYIWHRHVDKKPAKDSLGMFEAISR